MTLTPDRFPGEEDVEGLIFEEKVADPSVEGGVRYVSGRFRLKDVDSVFGLLFGRFAHYAESEGESSYEGSSAWQQKVRLTTSSLPAGTYRVGWYYEWQHEAIANDFLARLRRDDTEDLFSQLQEPQDGGTDQWAPASGFKHIALAAGVHTFDLDYATNDNLDASKIRRARIEFWRVS